MLRDISSVFSYQAVGILVGIASSIVTARAIGPEGKGELGLLMSSVSIVSLIFSFGLPSSIIYMVSCGRMSTRYSLKIGGVLLAATLVLTALIVVMASEVSLTKVLFGTNNDFLLFVVPFAAAIGVASGVFAATLAAHRLFVASNRIAILRAIAMLIISGGLLYCYGEQQVPTFSLYGMQLLVAVLACAAILLMAMRPELNNPIENQAPLSDSIRFGANSFGADLLQFLSYRFDYWIVGYFCGLKELGVYLIAVGLIQYTWMLPNAISGVLFPNIATGGAETERKAVDLAKVSFTVGTMGAILGCSLMFIAIPLAYGNDFSKAATMLSVLAIGAVPFCLCKVYAAVIAGKGHARLNLYAAAVGAVLTVILDLCLIPLWGALGAAAASSTAYLITAMIVLIFTAKVLDKSVMELMIPGQADLKLWRSRWKFSPSS